MGKLTLKPLEGGNRHVANNNVLSPDLKETGLPESPNKDALPHFLTPPLCLRNMDTKTPEDTEK